MEKIKEYSVISMNDYGSTNYVTDYKPIAILEDTTKETIGVIMAELADEWCLDDEEGKEFINESVENLINNKTYCNDDYEVSFKLETAYLYR